MDYKKVEERSLMLIVIIFLGIILFHDFFKFEKMDNIQIIENNSEDLIISENGIKKKVSKICPHMGCILDVNFKTNKLECPCHGSEFEFNGKLLEGPAREDLEVNSLREKFDNFNLKKLYDW